jgi:hypothetical protein
MTTNESYYEDDARPVHVVWPSLPNDDTPVQVLQDDIDDIRINTIARLVSVIRTYHNPRMSVDCLIYATGAFVDKRDIGTTVSDLAARYQCTEKNILDRVDKLRRLLGLKHLNIGKQQSNHRLRPVTPQDSMSTYLVDAIKLSRRLTLLESDALTDRQRATLASAAEQTIAGIERALADLRAFKDTL